MSELGKKKYSYARYHRVAMAFGMLAAISSGLTCLSSAEVVFQKDVLPVFLQHCQDCHGPENQKSGLRLDSAEAVLRGGESGEPVFIAGSSAKSHLVKLIEGTDPENVMPLEGQRLDSSEIAVIRKWIDEGAKLPDVRFDPSAAPETDHWSYQPIERPKWPPSADRFLANPIDAFVLGKLRERGLSPSSRADRRTLIRRLYLVMLGLPPTPSEVEAFLRDDHPEAYAKLVDSVLQSPRYGERWGRHWLDVVRYADTNGFETNRERKTAYHYRDYVIRAFNEDKPYDQFIIEHLAGDAVGADVATGFLVAGPYDIVKSPDINLTLMQRQDELADMVNTTGTAFLGLTMGCARCHNHKFDPILQKDYYAMQAVFAGVHFGERALKRDGDGTQLGRLRDLKSERASVERELEGFRRQAAGGEETRRLRPPVNAKLNTESFPPVQVAFVRFTIRATSSSEPCIDELEVYDESDVNVALASEGTTATASGTYPNNPFHKLEHVNDGKVGNERSWISDTGGQGWVQLAFPRPMTIDRVVWGRDRNERFKDRVATDYVIEGSLDGKQWGVLSSSQDREPFGGDSDPKAFLERLSDAARVRAESLLKRQSSLEQEIDTLEKGPQAWVANFEQPGKTHRLYRGDPMQEREVVAPNALTVLGSLDLDVDEEEQRRRLALARWIAGKENPLTARVLVNRLWHYIFGSGLAETPSDLGVNGVPPTHPELLDWLAAEFLASDWSIKHMQRLILLSNAFQQSGTPRSEAVRVDASALYLWRFPPRRLEAEAIRDSILATSGALDLEAGGPGFYLHEVEVENVMHYFPKETFGPEEFRRMVYLFKIRQEQDGIFGAFDCPDGNQVTPKRSRSNTPLQALNLFNSPFVMQQAGLLKERLQDRFGGDVESQIVHAFELLYGRRPDAFELNASKAIIEAEGFVAFCRALYNTSEFLFVF